MFIQDMQSGVVTSLYLLCCILRIVKIKDLANTIAAALFYPLEVITKGSGGKANGHLFNHGLTSESQGSDSGSSAVNVPYSSSASSFLPENDITQNDSGSSNLSVR